MSSDPNMPDFDAMSQDEMMAWMESLAKRQGADEAGFMTDADVDVAEVDPDTVDESILNQKYIPDGWTEEKWDAHLAKEEAEKQARLAEKQEAESAQPAEAQPEPEPEPTPAVAQAEAGADDTPDFDAMSPEEMMEWMESLAKRQGADASGFTTEAKMDVAEVDPSTVDESILNQEYRPEGWTEERWQAQLEKEAAEKQARMAEQELDFIPEPELVEESEPILDFIDDEDEELATMNLDDLPIIDIDDEEEEIEEETVASTENPMDWLENLAATDDDSAELDLPDLSVLGDDMEGLSALAETEAEGDPMDWLASLAGDVDDDVPDLDLGDMSAGLEGLEAFAIDDDLIEEEDESLPTLDVSGVDDPLNFLETLASQQGAPEEELSTEANASIPGLEDFILDDEDEEELDFEDVLEDTQPSEELDLGWAEDDPATIDNPEAWLDALASSSNEDSEQLMMFDDLDDIEDIEEEEFDEPEEETVLEADDDHDHDTRVIQALNSGQDVSPEDIDNFFKSQFKKAEEYAHLDEDFSDDEPEGEVEAAVAVDVPDWLQEMGGGPATSQAIDAEDEGEDLMADVLAGLEEEEHEELDLPDWTAELVDEEVHDLDWTGEVDDDDVEDVEIPDWLAEQAEALEVSDDEAEAVDIPDWLSEGAGADTGDIVSDIIADESEEIEPVTDDALVDPNDTWTQAFMMEQNEEDAEEWYTERLAAIDDEDLATRDAVGEAELDFELEPELEVASSSGAVALEPAALPREEELPEGQPEAVPAWLTGDAVDAPIELPPELEVVAEETPVDIPSWLEDSIDEDDEIELPDWLTEDTEEDPIPDWLADAGVSEIEPAAIPSWLTESVEEPADIVAQVVEPEPEPISPVPAQPVAVVQSPPPATDVSGSLQLAKEKVASGDIDDALHHYEAVVRANDGLDIAISDLDKLLKDEKYKKNPAIYRVLGDAQMRNGDLQTALDTYRRALNLL